MRLGYNSCQTGGKLNQLLGSKLELGTWAEGEQISKKKKKDKGFKYLHMGLII